MKDINQYRYITHKNKNIMIQVIVKNSKTGSQYICKIASVMVYQAARINQSMKLYKTVGAPFGAMKKLN